MYICDNFYCGLTYYFFCLFNHLPHVGTVPRVLVLSSFVLCFLIGIYVQVKVLIVRGASMQNVLPVVPGVVASSASLIILLLFYVQRKPFEALSLKFIEFYRKREREDVRVIKEKDARRLMSLLKFTICAPPFGVLGMFSTVFIPCLLDVIVPLNESRPLHLVYEAEFPIDHQKYFPILICYQFTISCMVVLVVLVLVNVIIMAILTAGTFFRIIGHQLKSLVWSAQPQQTTVDPTQVESLRAEIVHCIKEHENALEYAALVDRCADFVFLTTLVSTICALTFTLVQITDPQLVDVKCIIFGIGQVCGSVIVCLLGQNIMDESVRLSDKAYENNWYEFPINLQKLLLLFTIRSQRPSRLTITGIFLACNKSLATVLQTTVSYCMLLRQFQE